MRGGPTQGHLDFGPHGWQVQQRARVLGQVGGPAGRTPHRAGQGRKQPGQRAQQSRLAGTVRADERHHLARGTRQRVSVENGRGARRWGRRNIAHLPRGFGIGKGTAWPRDNRSSERIRRRRAYSPVLHDEKPIGLGQKRPEPVLGHDHGASLAGQPKAGRQHGFRALRIQLRGRLVERHDLRPHCQDGGELDALAFAPGESRQAATDKTRDRERRQDFVDPVVHLGPAQPGILEAEGDLALDRSVDRLRLHVLE